MRPATVTPTLADSPVAVLAVDDRPTFREAVRRLVAATPGMDIVGEAGSGEEAVELVEQLKPDLVLMDVRMPGIGGVSAARTIKNAHPSVVVALISTNRPEELAAVAEECSADALIWKRDLQPQLLTELWQRHRVA
jgi:DNA-binding NarL/FixJ family response regulator